MNIRHYYMNHNHIFYSFSRERFWNTQSRSLCHVDTVLRIGCCGGRCLYVLLSSNTLQTAAVGGSGLFDLGPDRVLLDQLPVGRPADHGLPAAALAVTATGKSGFVAP